MKISVEIEPVPERDMYLHTAMFSLSDAADGWEFSTALPPTLLLMRRPDGSRWKLDLRKLGKAMIAATETER